MGTDDARDGVIELELSEPLKGGTGRARDGKTAIEAIYALLDEVAVKRDSVSRIVDLGGVPIAEAEGDVRTHDRADAIGNVPFMGERLGIAEDLVGFVRGRLVIVMDGGQELVFVNGLIPDALEKVGCNS